MERASGWTGSLSPRRVRRCFVASSHLRALTRPHHVYIPARSPQEYFDRVPDKHREPLLLIREIICTTFPEMKESLERDIPSYHLGEKLIFSLASQKHFMVLHVHPHDLLGVFRNELRTHDHGKSCIRFRAVHDEDLTFISRVVKYVGTTAAQSTVELRQLIRS